MGAERWLYKFARVAGFAILLPGMSQHAQEEPNPFVETIMQSTDCVVTQICLNDQTCRSIEEKVEIRISAPSKEDGARTAFFVDGSLKINALPLPMGDNSVFMAGYTDDGPVVLIRATDGQMIMTKYFPTTPSVLTKFGTCEAIE